MHNYRKKVILNYLYTSQLFSVKKLFVTNTNYCEGPQSLIIFLLPPASEYIIKSISYFIFKCLSKIPSQCQKIIFQCLPTFISLWYYITKNAISYKTINKISVLYSMKEYFILNKFWFFFVALFFKYWRINSFFLVVSV